MTGALSLVSRDIRPAKAYPNAGNGRYRDAVALRNIFSTLFAAKSVDLHCLHRCDGRLSATLDVHGLWNRLQVIGVDAQSIAAKMVNVQAISNRAALTDIYVPVCNHRSAIFGTLNHAVAVRGHTAVPIPASSRFIDNVLRTAYPFVYFSTTFTASAVKAIARNLAKIGSLYIANIEGRIRQFLMTGKTNTGTIVMHLDCLLYRLIEVPRLGMFHHRRGFLRTSIIPNFRALMGSSLA